MNYELNDRVCIIASGKTGCICDAQIQDGKALYIVDCFGECDGDSVADCVITVEEHEIELLSK